MAASYSGEWGRGMEQTQWNIWENGRPWYTMLVKTWICNLRIAGSSLTADGLFFWYGPLASLSLQIASVASEHHGEKMEVPTSGL